MGTIASQITSLTIVYSIVYSDADQRKHQNSASLAFVPGSHRPVTRIMFPFDDVIMWREHIHSINQHVVHIGTEVGHNGTLKYITWITILPKITHPAFIVEWTPRKHVLKETCSNIAGLFPKQMFGMATPDEVNLPNRKLMIKISTTTRSKFSSASTKSLTSTKIMTYGEDYPAWRGWGKVWTAAIIIEFRNCRETIMILWYVWERISYFIPHFTTSVITYSHRHLS